MAIGEGRKWTRKAPTETTAFIFYVRRKRPAARLGSARVPKWVFDRSPDGAVDRSVRYSTDVEAIGSPIGCASGYRIRRPSIRSGTVTLAFDQMDADGRRQIYAVSCTHVIGHPFSRSFGTTPRVSLRNPDQGIVEGVTEAHRSVSAGELDYDVALARLTRGGAGLPLRSIPRIQTRLSRLQAGRIGDNRSVSVVAARSSGVRSARVRARLAGPVRGICIKWRGKLVPVDLANLYDARGFVPREGDSGALVFAGSTALGIVVAKHDEGFFFHHLRDSLVALVSGTDIRIDEIL